MNDPAYQQPPFATFLGLKITHTSPEKVAAVGSAVVVDYGKGITASRLNVEKLTGERMTQRNWNTVLGIWGRMRER